MDITSRLVIPGSVILIARSRFAHLLDLLRACDIFGYFKRFNLIELISIVTNTTTGTN